MNLLAIETSTEACSVALLCGSDMQTDHRMAAQQHGRLVLPMIDELMAHSGLSVAQLDGVVFGCGPGSVTGVRIAVALTQGIALGADVGVVGISTMNTVAQGAHRVYGDQHLAISLDARMGEVYFAAYTLSEESVMRAVTEEFLCAPEKLPELDGNTPWQWAGTGAERYTDILLEHYHVEGDSIRADVWPDAQDLISLAIPKVQRGELQACETAMPVYLRNKVADTTAEREFAKKAKIQLRGAN